LTHTIAILREGPQIKAQAWFSQAVEAIEEQAWSEWSLDMFLETLLSVFSVVT
jgi:hypothetical protein